MNEGSNNNNQEFQDLRQEQKTEVSDEQRSQLAKRGFGGILVAAAILLIFFVLSGGDDKKEEIKEEGKAPVVEKMQLGKENPFSNEPDIAAIIAAEAKKNAAIATENVRLIKGLSGGAVATQSGQPTGKTTTGTVNAAGGGIQAAIQAANDRAATVRQQAMQAQAQLEAALSSQGEGIGSSSGGTVSRDTGYEKKIVESTAATVTAKKSTLDPNLALDKGTFVPCVLKTAIVSTIAGNIACIITNDVYSAAGTVLLIEKGSTVQGSFRSGMIQPGMNRLFIIWEEIRTPGRIVIDVLAPATDTLGGSGVEGWVDNHYLQRFGGAILLSMIDDAFSAAFDNKDGR
ncbi:MAG: hypothetical protein LBQ18_02455, partial [Campylobacteraceae bacterium]|nr:hypothetical protein [Campylobacteraceae bacterium]